jgi:putative NADPH-quinone reductase
VSEFAMKIYLLLGHPDKQSLNGAFADAYERQAIARGHEVRRHNVGELQFDPILRSGSKQAWPELEPDLKQAQENILWCEHWVMFYPIWWGSVPALFKGYIDRTLHSGFAFKYHENDPFWDKLLKGRSAHVFTTSDAPWFWIFLKYRNSDLNAVRRATLEFCGVSPVKVTRFSGVRASESSKRVTWIEKVAASVPR